MDGSESPMRAWSAATGIGVVHDVVVNERAGLQQFECCYCANDLGTVVAACAAPTPVRKRWTKALATPEQGVQCIEEWLHLIPNGVQNWRLLRKERLKFFVDPVPEIFDI